MSSSSRATRDTYLHCGGRVGSGSQHRCGLRPLPWREQHGAAHAADDMREAARLPFGVTITIRIVTQPGFA